MDVLASLLVLYLAERVSPEREVMLVPYFYELSYDLLMKFLVIPLEGDLAKGPYGFIPYYSFN